MLKRVTPFLLAGLTALPCHAFTVEGPKGGGKTALDHFLNAPRWIANTDSLITSGTRGLGGGLEYVLDDSLCELQFVETDLTCEDIKSAFRQALAVWSEGHPDLNFTDVSSEVRASFPLAALGETDQGAEIDVFAARPAQFPPFLNSATHAFTFFYTKQGGAYRSTNGRIIAPSDGWIESADIRFSTTTRYTLGPTTDCQPCISFPALALHEIGHALGIGHADEMPQYNLDTDSMPGNAMHIDCQQPENGLKNIPDIDGNAISIGQNVGHWEQWQRGLSFDDLAARNALYPNCNIKTIR